MKRINYLKLFLMLLVTSNVFSQTDNNWLKDFDGKVDGEVFDIVSSQADQKIYFCGGFLSANYNSNMKNMARWNPISMLWEQIPGINSSHSNFIRCMAQDENGDLYVGGDFSNIGGVPAGKVAKFVVSTGKWISLKDETYFDEDQLRGPSSGGVYSIAVKGNNLYIGGYTFNSTGDADTTYKYKYIRSYNLQTKKWDKLGRGINGKISALAIDGSGNLYAGGSFTKADWTSAANIAKWDGTKWTPLGAGVNGEVKALKFANGKLYVAGSFTKLNGVINSAGVGIWNGSSWEAMGAGLARSSGTLYVQDIDVDASGKVFVGGFFDKRASDNTALNNCAYFNGTDWQAMGSGLGRTTTQGVNAVYANGNDVYFGGPFANPIGAITSQISHALWNETTNFTQDFIPAVSVNSYEVGNTTLSPFLVTIKFSEVVTGFDISDVQLTNSTSSNFTNTVTGKEWTVKIIPTSSGIVTVKVPASAAIDATSHNNTVSNTFSINYSAPINNDIHWHTQFDGIIEGEVFDICKSSVDNKIYFSGGFLSVNGNTDMKNIVRYNPAGNVWEHIEGIDYTQENFFRCMITDENGDIYVGGDFSTIDGVPVGKVAKFEVATGTWKSLKDKTFLDDEQMRGPNSGGVYAIAKNGNYIYIGGYTFNSTNPALRYIRRFDLVNQKWEAVAGGVDYKISAFAVDNSGNLYAGGSFITAGGVTVNNIAKFDGSTWSALGTGTNGSVNALKWHNGKLYVAGSFSHVNGNIRSQGIACWNGVSWESMDKGVDNSQGTYTVQDIGVDSDGKIYIGGFFDMRFSDDSTINHVAVYDGNKWKALGAGLGTSSTQGINAIYADGKNVYFGGMFSKSGLLNQAIWNETKDFTQNANPGVYIFDYETNPVMKNSYQILINFSQSVTGFQQSDIVITNATITNFENLSANKRFRITVAPIAEGFVTVTVPQNAATANGLASVVSNTYKNFYYQGSKNWFFNFDGIVEGEIYDIIHSNADDKIYFSGGFLQVNGNQNMKNIARWNMKNNTWEQIPGIDYTHENFIRCMTQDEQGNLYVGGDFSTIGGIPAGRVAKFNVISGKWESLRDANFFTETQQRGPESGGVYAIAYNNNNVYIGGWTFNNSDSAYRYIRRYNTVSKTWESVGTGVNAKISAFAFDNSGNLYAGGVFTNAGGVLANNVAKWNGTSWSALGLGTNAAVYDLKFHNGNLYVAGDFTKVGNNIRSQGIAKWNGTTWEAMGEGIDNSSITPSVYGISIAENGKVYIGGYFDMRFSDDKKINHVAVFENNDWEPLEYGLANSTTQGINTVYAHGNNVFFGGAFTKPIVSGILNQAIWNPDFDFTQDLRPAVSITTTEPTITANKTYQVKIKFTEEVSALNKTDISVINGGVIKLTQQVDTKIYIAEVVPLIDGDVKIFMLENKVKDLTNNFNLASDTLIINYNSNLANIDNNWFFAFNGLISGEVYDICKSSIDNKIYFAGGFLSVNNNSNMKNLVRYIPSTNTWEQVPGISSSHNNFIRCMAQDAAGNLYVGGDFSSIGGVTVGRVAKFDVNAGTWSALEDPTFFETSQKKGPNSGGVYAIAVSGDYVYIGGHTFNSSNAAYLYIRRFNTFTNKWEAVGSGVDAKVSALTVDGSGNVYAGGIFTTAGGVAVNNIAKWSGTTWSALGQGVNGGVNELKYANNNLYAAGTFTKVGNNIRSQCIAVYDGANWNAMGQGIDNSSITPSVYGIAVDSDNKVYIGGYFDLRYSDDGKVNHTAVFEGNEWQPMGNGLGQSSTQGINVLFADGNNIYAGGAFSKPLGGTQNTAIWNKNTNFTPDVAPNVRIYSFENIETASNPIEVYVEFSEAVNGFDISDITVTNGMASGLSTVILNSKYRFDVTPTIAGTVKVDFLANKVNDLTGNPNTAATQFTINYNPSVSIAEFENNNIKLYPNPCTNYINIALEDQNSETEIVIINLQGNIVFQKKINLSKVIDVSFLKNGIYVIKIINKNNIYKGKFTKNN